MSQGAPWNLAQTLLEELSPLASPRRQLSLDRSTLALATVSICCHYDPLQSFKLAKPGSWPIQLDSWCPDRDLGLFGRHCTAYPMP